MLSLQEISDRLEIQQVMTDYAHAIDTRDFEALDRIFTPDAFIDYTAMGGIKGPYPQIKAWLKDTMKWFPNYYHMVGNHSITIEGDCARSRVICFNPIVMNVQDKPHTMFFGLWYLDQWVRTADGWRMTERVEEKCFDYNLPAAMPKVT